MWLKRQALARLDARSCSDVRGFICLLSRSIHCAWIARSRRKNWSPSMGFRKSQARRAWATTSNVRKASATQHDLQWRQAYGSSISPGPIHSNNPPRTRKAVYNVINTQRSASPMCDSERNQESGTRGIGVSCASVRAGEFEDEYMIGGWFRNRCCIPV